MGSQESQSTSAPVSPAQRLETYQKGMSAINPTFAKYNAPNTERLAVNYNQLQNDLATGYEAPIRRAQTVDLQAADQAMADRGIYTSLNALRARNDVNERYIPQYAQAGANATNSRMQLQEGDIAAQNAIAMENANRLYESKWRPEDYKAGVWNGTGGVVSTGTSGGWSI